MAQKISEMGALPNPLDGTEKVEASQSDGVGGFNTGSLELSDAKDWVFSQASVMPNDVSLQGKDTAGTAQDLVKVGTDDRSHFGNSTLITTIDSLQVPRTKYEGSTWELITSKGGQTINGIFSATSTIKSNNTGGLGLEHVLNVDGSFASIRFRNIHVNVDAGFDIALFTSGGTAIRQTNGAGTFEKSCIDFVRDGGVIQRFNGATKTATTASGLDVTGNVNASSLVITGSFTTATLPSAAANTGGIAYDSTISKHVGSDGSTWNAMY